MWEFTDKILDPHNGQIMYVANGPQTMSGKLRSAHTTEFYSGQSRSKRGYHTTAESVAGRLSRHYSESKGRSQTVLSASNAPF